MAEASRTSIDTHTVRQTLLYMTFRLSQFSIEGGGMVSLCPFASMGRDHVKL